MKRIAILLISLGACSHRLPASDDQSAERALVEAGYPERLLAVQELARTTPGYIQDLPFGYAPKRLGLWAGIWLQTDWQRSSQRMEFLHWRLPNTVLTLVPQRLWQERRAGIRCEDSSLAPSVDDGQLEVCRAWNGYFSAAESGSAKRVVLRHRLWVAHTAALARAIRVYERELAAEVLPPEEQAFWSNWVRLVYWLEVGAMPTTDLFGEPILRGRMPTCAPLGAANCQVELLPHKQRHFAKFMIQVSTPDVSVVRRELGLD